MIARSTQVVVLQPTTNYIVDSCLFTTAFIVQLISHPGRLMYAVGCLSFGSTILRVDLLHVAPQYGLRYRRLSSVPRYSLIGYIHRRQSHRLQMRKWHNEQQACLCKNSVGRDSMHLERHLLSERVVEFTCLLPNARPAGLGPVQGSASRLRKVVGQCERSQHSGWDQRQL